MHCIYALQIITLQHKSYTYEIQILIQREQEKKITGI